MSFDFSPEYEIAPEHKRVIVKKDVSFFTKFQFGDNDLSDIALTKEKGTFKQKPIQKLHKKLAKFVNKNSLPQTPKKAFLSPNFGGSKITSQISTPQNSHYQESTADNSIDDASRNSILRQLYSNLNSPIETEYLNSFNIQINPQMFNSRLFN